MVPEVLPLPEDMSVTLSMAVIPPAMQLPDRRVAVMSAVPLLTDRVHQGALVALVVADPVEEVVDLQVAVAGPAVVVAAVPAAVGVSDCCEPLILAEGRFRGLLFSVLSWGRIRNLISKYALIFSGPPPLRPIFLIV